MDTKAATHVQPLPDYAAAITAYKKKVLDAALVNYAGHSDQRSPAEMQQMVALWPLGCGEPAEVEIPAYAAKLLDKSQSLPGCGEMPSLARMGWNLATSLASFVADGCATVDTEEYQRRLEICDGCEHRRENRCTKCGCYLSLKAKGRAFQCPEGKWNQPTGA